MGTRNFVDTEEIPKILITKEMIDVAIKNATRVNVNRTKTSMYDSVYGLVGEYCFAQWFIGEWKEHSALDTKGKEDFYGSIEIKTSAFPFTKKLNVLVREDYAEKRKPNFYVQNIINIENRKGEALKPQTECFITGFATSKEIDSAPLKDFGSKFGGSGGYKCRYIPIENLSPMNKFKSEFNKLHSNFN
jgi:hypothetical protein